MKPLQQSCQIIAEVYDALLLDLDGVVYIGQDAVPGVVGALNEVHSKYGVALTCVTNNAARSSAAVAEHLTELGLAVTAQDVVTSAQAGAAELAKLLPQGARVFVCGSRDLMREVELVGLVASQDFDQEHDAVVNGYWPDMPWRMLGQAAGIISSGVPWVATNMDLTIPTKFGMSPGNGSMVNALIHATGRRPTVIAGKPEKPLMLASIERTKAKKPIVVGDRLDTDILGANNVEIDSLLVLSGVTSVAELLNAVPSERPTYLGWDATSVLLPQPEVEVQGSSVKLDGYSVDRAGLRGSGDSLDAIRVCAVAAWLEICPVDELLANLASRGIN